jgi:hypothetical protein
MLEATRTPGSLGTLATMYILEEDCFLLIVREALYVREF